MTELHPLDAGLLEIKAPMSGLEFPPQGWMFLQQWGLGYALLHKNGLRVIVDCSLKEDDRWWIHISVSRRSTTPTHHDMAMVKVAFLGNRYAYAVYPPENKYVNIHQHCLHLWSVVDAGDGRILPEFSSEVPGFGNSI